MSKNIKLSSDYLLGTDFSPIDIELEFILKDDTFLNRMKDSFVSDIKEGKQIDRYLQKVKKQIFEYVTTRMSRIESKDSGLSWFSSMVALAIISSTYQDIKEISEINERIVNDIMPFLSSFAEENLLCKRYDEEEKKFVRQDISYLKEYFVRYYQFHNNELEAAGWGNFEDLFDRQLKISASKTLGFISAREGDSITKENFVIKTLPLGEEDLSRLIYDILYGLIVSCDKLLNSLLAETEIQRTIGRRLEARDNTIKKLKEENKRLRQINKQQQDALDKVSEAIFDDNEEEEEDDEVYTELLNRNFELTRREAKTRRLYNSLLEKHKALLDAVGEPEIDDKPIEETEVKKLDLNGRYIFIADESCTTFSSNIKNTFPNSEVTDGALDFSPEAVDMVVIITELIPHASAVRVKNVCRSKNIPMLHCAYKNPEMIKNLMEHYVNTK